MMLTFEHRIYIYVYVPICIHTYIDKIPKLSKTWHAHREALMGFGDHATCDLEDTLAQEEGVSMLIIHVCSNVFMYIYIYIHIHIHIYMY